MAVWGYVRVSTDQQNTENQKLAILEYANRNHLTVDRWIEVKASSQKSSRERRIDELLEQLQASDTLMVGVYAQIVQMFHRPAAESFFSPSSSSNLDPGSFREPSPFT